MPPGRTTRHGSKPYPTAPQIRDAYSQLPLQFGKPSFQNSKSKKSKFPSSASGSNCTPLSTPEEVEARRQASLAWKTGRAPSKFVDVGGFRVPAPPLAEIEGRGLNDNKELAAGLKMMLEGDDAEGKDINTVNDFSTEQTPTRYSNEKEALSRAFQQEYSLPSSKSSQLFQTPETHIDRRSRTDIIAGQEVGLGVIGSAHSPLHAVTAEGKRYMARVVEGEHGCDTPSYSFEDARRGIAIPEGCLDPDLPPLAIEHPARMWNSLIHSLEPGLQPVVKWNYQRSGAEYTANLTLALPPTHPSMISHPLFITVPKNINSKEYIAVLELLGGVKTYTGESRRLKAEAQNSALVKCIADNAISWIYAPVTKGHVDPEKDDENPGDEATKREVAGDGVMEEMAGSDEIVIDDEVEDSPETSWEPEIYTSIQGNIEMESDEEFQASKRQIDDERCNIPNMTEMEYLEWVKNHFSSSSPSSLCRTSPSVAEDVVDTEVDEVVPDLEEVEYSTDNSSIIEDSDLRKPTPHLDALNRLIALAKSEGRDIETEIVTHEMAGWSEESETIFFSQLLIIWPDQQKASAVLDGHFGTTEAQAIENLCESLEEGDEIDMSKLLRAIRAPAGVDDEFTDLWDHPGCLIETCYLKELPAPQFGTCVVNSQTCGHLQIGDLSMTDSKPVVRTHGYDGLSTSWKLRDFWVRYSAHILKLMGRKKSTYCPDD